MPAIFPLDIYRGDTQRWRFSLWDDTEKTQPSDLANVTAQAQIRDRPGSQAITDLACQITLPNTIDMTLSAVASRGLPEEGRWDLELTYAGGDVVTLLAGPVTVTPDITAPLP